MKKVITYGSFDLFHEGHYNILKRAKELGDYLIVGVTTEHYDRSRGKLNLIDPIMTRIENVKKTGFADEIIVEDHDGQKVEELAFPASLLGQPGSPGAFSIRPSPVSNSRLALSMA